MAEAGFSEDGKYFSAISQDGRLRIWDTETNVLKQEYTPDLHLTSPPSCLQWISVTQSAGPSKNSRRKSSVSDPETRCIALGTTSGKILLYSVAQAKAETVLEEKSSQIHNKNITSLDWHRNYGLYSCSKDSFVLQWNLQSGAIRNKYNVNVDCKNKQANLVSAIKIVPHNQNTSACYLITVSAQVRVWRFHNGDAEIIKCLGHNATSKALLAIASLNNTCWLIEGSQTERLLSFWDVTITSDHMPQVNGEATSPNKKKRKKSTSTPITVPSPTYNFMLEDAPKMIDVNVTEDEGTRLTLAATTRSGVLHYYMHMLNGASTKPIKPCVTVQVTTPEASPRPLLCCRLQGDLLVGYSQGPTIVFERLTPDLKSKTQVLIRGDGSTSKRKQKQEVTKTREDVSNDVTYVEPMGGVSRKRPTPGGKVEVPMEQRLANLTMDSRSRGAVSQNMSKLLMQGLHSKDKRLIQTVLSNNSANAARQTVSGLPADYVPMLLEQLADMATRKTTQCASVCTWLSAILRAHSALLLATINVNTASHLTHLLATFTHRRSHLCQLLNLKGRVELTMSQREPKEQQIEQQAVLEYKDTSSDSEMEVEGAASESEGDGEWDEEGEGEGQIEDSDDDGD